MTIVWVADNITGYHMEVFCKGMEWSSPRINSRISLFFIIHINDLLLKINSIWEPLLFADNTSVIISSRNFEDFYLVSNLGLMIKWFAANNLVLNLDKQI